jgi:hypothetical protein
MVAVAVLALVLYGRRVQQHRQILADLCGIADRGVRHTGAVYRLDRDREVLHSVTPETPARTPAEVEARRLRSSYWVALKAKYERAAARPWLPVTPDPPEPL